MTIDMVHGCSPCLTGEREDRYPPRETLPVPDKPPYTAHIGNLSYESTEAEIAEFFASCEVANVRLVRDRMEDRPKGFGYVEFSTREGLIAALELNGLNLSGRNIRINVAEPRTLSYTLASFLNHLLTTL